MEILQENARTGSNFYVKANRFLKFDADNEIKVL